MKGAARKKNEVYATARGMFILVMVMSLLLATAGCLPDREAGAARDSAAEGPEFHVGASPAQFWRQPPLIVDRADTILVMNDEEEGEVSFPGMGSLMVKRRYPYGTLAAALIGYRGKHGHGLYGLEYLCDTLAGPDAKGVPKHLKGDRLRLTISKDIQLWAEMDLKRQISRLGAKSGCLVFMDVSSGEILAMASLPAWNPARAWEKPGEEPVNHAIHDEIDAWLFFPILEWGRRYAEYRAWLMENEAEAGSSADSKMDSGAAKKDIFSRKGRKRWSWSTPAPGLALWSPWNGEATAAFDFSPNDVRQMWALGIGQVTGMGLAGEKSGSLPRVSPSSWGDVRFNSVRATPVQIARAFSALISGGKAPVPSIIRAGESPEPEEAGIDWLNEETVKWMLAELALGDGPSIAALKRSDGLDSDAVSTSGNERVRDGKCSEVVSLGFWPEKSPRIAYISVLKETTHDPRVRRGTLGKTIVFAKKAFNLLKQETSPGNMLASRPKKGMKSHDIMPDFRGMTMRQAVVAAMELGFQTRVAGSGRVFRQRPGPGATIGTDKICFIECSADISSAGR